MGENTLRALASDLAYLESWAMVATDDALPWPASESLALKFVAHHLWDPAKRAVDPLLGCRPAWRPGFTPECCGARARMHRRRSSDGAARPSIPRMAGACRHQQGSDLPDHRPAGKRSRRRCANAPID